MGQWVHRLETVDPDTKTGTCSNCGPIAVCYRPSRDQWVCSVAKKSWRRPPSEESYNKNKEYKKQRTFQKYALTAQEYHQMVEDQDNRCAWCGCTEVENGQRLAIDHCHETGTVRRLLCRECNMAEGYLKSKPQLIAAIEAVAWWKGN